MKLIKNWINKLIDEKIEGIKDDITQLNISIKYNNHKYKFKLDDEVKIAKEKSTEACGDTYLRYLRERNIEGKVVEVALRYNDKLKIVVEMVQVYTGKELLRINADMLELKNQS